MADDVAQIDDRGAASAAIKGGQFDRAETLLRRLAEQEPR
jgi:hypothetical protein